MSNVHQLVVELAKYEQQRKDLEAQLDKIHSQHFIDEENAFDFGTGLSEEQQAVFENTVDKLEAELDAVWIKIDDLNELIDEDSNHSHGYDDDDY